MHDDLAKMSKAKGIYRTLSLLAILSTKPAGNENGENPQGSRSHKADKGSSSTEFCIKKKRLDRKDSNVD
jgi:hypothetical protein